ncbi:MAG: hypothetical protein GY861_00910 [bacterium]|nr:hypothetical protein [bacterium]
MEKHRNSAPDVPIEAVTQWKAQYAHRKNNLLCINHQKYELGGKVSSLKAAGRPRKDTIYPFFSMIDSLVEVLGDSPKGSALDPEHWKLLNEIAYNEIHQFSGCLRNTKDRQRTKRALLEMMQLLSYTEPKTHL